MKLCPQCEFIYEDDQRFCDMDGRELVHDPSARVFAESVPISAAPLRNDQRTTTVTKIHIPIPQPMTSPAANAAAGRPSKLPLRWHPRGLALAALAGLVLVTLLFVVYYARTRQSQTRKANRSAGQSTSQFGGRPNAPEATQSAATQAAATDSASESVKALGDAGASAQPPEQLSLQSSDQSSNEAVSATLLTSQSTSTSSSTSSSTLPAGSDKAALRVRPSSTLVAARPPADATREPVTIRLTNGASIKADEAWEKRDGVWYRQAGMVTFLKRSRVRSIQRPSAARSQTEPKTKAEKSIAQNQPRVGTPEAVNAKKNSKVTSFLKKTGRILKKPFTF
jgi:hypothetical protein